MDQILEWHRAIEKGWYWAILDFPEGEVGLISKEDQWLVRTLNGKIHYVEPGLDRFHLNII